jgi:twinkle protein
MRASNSKFRGIFVTADDPKFLENRVVPERELLDLEKLNIAEIRAQHLARQRNFDTAPFDPEGRVMRFFPGGYTVWSGFPGAGKTTLLRQLACHLMAKGKHVLVASLEENPVDVFYRHASVALGTDDPSQAGLEWCVFHWADRLRLWSPECLPAPHQRLFAAIRVLAAEGVRHAIIDSLMCLDVASGDWEGQRLFANTLLRTLKSSNLHIHLVAHPRKIINADQEPDINDVAGAADIGRLADNVIFVRRAKAESLTANVEVTPMRIAILKQRHGTGKTGEIQGWFNRSLRQFKVGQFDLLPEPYLPRDAYTEQGRATP